MRSSLKMARNWRRLAGLGVACVAVLVGTSAPLRHEASVLATGARAGLINAGLLHLGQLAVAHVRPAPIAAPDDGWTPARLSDLHATGPILGPFSSRDGTIAFSSAIPAQAGEAVISFDLYLFGSWDGRFQPYGGVEGDGIVFSVNGVPFHREIFQNWGRAEAYRSATVSFADTTYALTLVRQSAQQDYRGTGAHFDSSWSLRLEAEGHPAQMRFALHSTANDPADEHFAVARLVVQHD